MTTRGDATGLLGKPSGPHRELDRLIETMFRLRTDCPWNAQQTHRSLVRYLVEETCEVVEAIESGTDDDLCEELGDLLLQVVFHAAIAATDARFDLDDVAGGIADKLVERHPWVFTDAGVPDDLNATWETAKKAAKGRKSAIDGIPHHLSALTRAAKVFSRMRSHGVRIGLPRADETITADEVGATALELVARAQAAGIDPEQAVRDSLREFEARVRRTEADEAE